MSLKKKLTEVAAQAAKEATANERARCLWCLDDLVRHAEREVSNKVLTEAQLHLARVKLQIAQQVAGMARRAIVCGARPPDSPECSSTAVLFPAAVKQLLLELLDWNKLYFADDYQLKSELENRLGELNGKPPTVD